MPEQLAQQPQYTTSTQQVNWKRVVWIVAAAVVILAIVTLLWWWFVLRAPSQAPSPTTTPSQKQLTPNATPSAKKDETEGWKTFSKEGITFKYPPRLRSCCGIQLWVENQGQEELGIFGDVPETELGSDKPFDGLAIAVDPNISNKPFAQYIESKKEEWRQNFKQFTGQFPTNVQETEIVIAGQNAILLKGLVWFGIDIIYVPFPNSQKVLIIGKNKTSSDSFKEFDQILSTFRFLD